MGVPGRALKGRCGGIHDFGIRGEGRKGQERGSKKWISVGWHRTWRIDSERIFKSLVSISRAYVPTLGQLFIDSSFCEAHTSISILYLRTAPPSLLIFWNVTSLLPVDPHLSTPIPPFHSHRHQKFPTLAPRPSTQPWTPSNPPDFL